MRLSLLLPALIYGYFLISNVSKDGWTTATPYYNYLLQSFLDGRTDVNAPVNHDMSVMAGKYFLNWGPAGVVGVIPFYVVSGVQASDRLYTFFYALLNCYLFLSLCLSIRAFLKLETTSFGVAALVLAFAFVSPNFFLAGNGSIWFYCQTISLTYALISANAAFQFLKSGSSRFLYLTVFCYCLAWFTRLTYAPYGLLLLPLLWYHWVQERKAIAFDLGIVCGILVIFLVLCLMYNYVRFGSVFDFGMKYIIPPVSESGDLASWTAFRTNLELFFTRSFHFTLEPPYSNFHPIGSSVPSIYPFVAVGLWLIWHRKSFSLWTRSVLLLALAAVSFELAILLPKEGSGWTQVGSRYFSTIITICYACSVLIVDKVPKTVLVSLIVYGGLAQFYCMIQFYKGW